MNGPFWWDTYTSNSQRAAMILLFINSRSISGNRARSSGVNLADGATLRPFVRSKLRCHLLTFGVSSRIRATNALTAAVSVQSKLAGCQKWTP